MNKNHCIKVQLYEYCRVIKKTKKKLKENVLEEKKLHITWKEFHENKIIKQRELISIVWFLLCQKGRENALTHQSSTYINCESQILLLTFTIFQV